jgi:hypothetical protein
MSPEFIAMIETHKWKLSKASLGDVSGSLSPSVIDTIRTDACAYAANMIRAIRESAKEQSGSVEKRE